MKLAFLISAFLIAPIASQAALVKKPVEYKVSGKPFEGYVVYDDATKEARPGILIGTNWMGVSDEARSKAEQFAQLGYVAFVADMYGKGQRPKNGEEAAAMAGPLRKDRATVRKRMQAGLKVLRDMPQADKKRLAAAGYCFGGMAAVELARSGADIKSVVSFHGGLDSPTPADGKNIKAKILALHGANDPYVPAADLAAFEDEMRKNNIDWELVKYGGAVHSFTEKAAGDDPSQGAAYNASADKRSWEAAQDFLKETL